MRPVNEVKIMVRGVAWRLRRYRPRGVRWGWCIYARKLLLVDDRLRGKKELEILLHEYNHALQPDLSEEAILEISKNQTDYLYDVLGYRR
jgi:hypothetical protein